MPASQQRFGFIGLGDMGGPMAANIAKAGHDIVVHDKAGTAARAPKGAAVANDIASVARMADTVFVSVPDASASLAVADAIVGTGGRRVRTVVDLSTIGVEGAEALQARYSPAGIVYADAPVSGGRSGAIAGTISLMWSGSASEFERLKPVLASFAGSLFNVGERPGQGQALKLLNNFLSATAMIATSEAVHYGLSKGLPMRTILDVVNVSTGRNTASSDKFPNRILTGSFDAGFRMAFMAKDVALFRRATQVAGTPADLTEKVHEFWQSGAAEFPAGDFTEIYKVVGGMKQRATN